MEILKKKRLMIITHDLALGGLQQVVVNLCHKINRDIFDVFVLCLRTLGDYAPELEKAGIKVILLPHNKNGVDYFAFLKAAKILKQEKIDILHTHNTQPFIDGVIGGLLAGVKTIVHTDHARAFPDKRRYMFAEWILSHFIYKVVAVSQHTAQNLIKYEKISPRKIAVIPNGIDGGKYAITIDKNKKRDELGITNQGPIIGIGVRLCEQKGITYLLKAMPRIIKDFPDCTLVIAGRGPLEENLKKEAEDLGILPNVKFIGMRLDVPALLKLFDVYVLPSLWEGMPMVLLEAMAAECAIVATDVGGVATVISSGKTGILIPAKSEDEIAGAVLKILNDSTARKQMVKNAKQLFNEKYDARIMTKEYESLFLKEII
ncbi:MAG: glycosyltransferase [Candidatus Pacebacteria bacterium]|nr:glycosyltransferase [Candidatus Paceibacterota bacterium]